MSDGLIELGVSDEYNQTHSIFLVANETGHICYYRNDIFDLAVAMLATACYQTGFHVCMLSKKTVQHRVRAFRGPEEADTLLSFELNT